MAVNLSKRPIDGYEYSETIADGETGESVLIPPELNKNLTCTIVASTNIGKIQFTTSTNALVLSDNANWQDWPLGEITGTVYDTLESPVTALRGVSISGEIKLEFIG